MMQMQRIANRIWMTERRFAKEYIAQKIVSMTVANKYRLMISKTQLMINRPALLS
jgi:hypothetical protein